MKFPTALIAEDEPLLAQALHAELSQLWPELRVLAVVRDGLQAESQALALRPDLLFFDIRMPGQTGLEAACHLADLWDLSGQDAKPFPALVFVTAYDQYALQAFEAQAVDYLLKPVQTDRLNKTLAKLKQRWTQSMQTFATPSAALPLETVLAQLHALGKSHTPQKPRLQWIQTSTGNTIEMVPIQDVVAFQALDKYVQVQTPTRNFLVRTPLKDLLAQLDPDQFWQVHRGTVVRVSEIGKVQRDESGKLQLRLKCRPERINVSRLFAHLFKAM